jgi:transglutaminase-like putative cysteine protease
VLDGIGWVDADPTNNVLHPERHLTVAWGRDYSDVAPTRGVIVGPPTSQSTLVSVDVTRSDDSTDG